MAKSIVDKAVVAGVNYSVVEADVKDGHETIKIRYNIPATFADFQRLVASTPEAQGAELLAHHCYSVDLKARARSRESATVQQPVIMTKKYGKLNLVTGEFGVAVDSKNPKAAGLVAWSNEPIPLANRVKMLNAAMLLAQSKEEDIPPSIRTAHVQLLESKTCTERNGLLVAR